MSEIKKITDYDAEVLALLLAQYKDSPKLIGIVSAQDTQAEELEAAIFEVRDLFWLDTAEGKQLDVLGDIFNERRRGRTDSEYREAIRFRGGQSLSGEPEAIINVLKSLYSGTFVEYTPEWPIEGITAQYHVRTDAVITDEQLQFYTAAGIQGLLYGYLVDYDGNYIVDANGNHIGGVTGTEN